MLIVLLMTFWLPRKFILAPLMFGLFLLPFGQTFVIGGVHLYVTRILILAGLIRSVISRPPHGRLLSFGYTSIDKIFTLWTVFRATAFVLVHSELASLVNQLGFLWDALGGYFLMRLLIRTDADVRRTVKGFGGICALLSVTMLYEKVRGINLYGLIAGHVIIPEIREGSIRAQGPFHHAILAGTFGATLLPLFFWLWKSHESRLLGLVGIGASTAITVSSASSTPAGAYLASVVAICFWLLREKMRLVRWGIVVGVLLLNFVMHAPVWWVFAHVDLAGGSAGHQRAELIDNFVNHFGDWWLIGTKDNGSWGFLMMDVSNQYVAAGESGGLVSLICIIAVITLAFKRIGNARRVVQDRSGEWCPWLLGSALFAHTVAFFGISYFDQTQYAWYALLAMISAVTTFTLKSSEVMRGRDKEGQRLSYVRTVDEFQFGMNSDHAGIGRSL
jgi:hypothetical protein